MATPDLAPTFDEVDSSFRPLVRLLQQELRRAGRQAPGVMPVTPGEFSRWYLDVVQILSAQVGGGDAMQRGEVELMCRCAMSGRDLREVIELCARYCAMLAPRAGSIGFDDRGGVASFRLDSLRTETTTASSLVDITGLFAFQQLFQWLLGVELPLRQVCIGPIQRDDVLPFLRLFRAPVLAGGDRYALEFESRALVWPAVRGAGEFDAFFEVFPCGVFNTGANTLPQQVSALLTAAAARGDKLPSQQQLAAALELPLSTFRQRLAAGGTSFRALRRDCLRDAATRLLLSGELGVADIAQRLGFSDAGAFRRAFHQWFGVAPVAWRELCNARADQ